MKVWKTAVVAGAIALALTLSPSVAKAQIPLGIVVQETPTGVVVTDVFQGGIADRCMPRLRPGARIVTVNGDPVTSAEQFRLIVESSTFVRFQFVDVRGELRWARAWSGGRIPLNCRP
jgi:S1-C subfamily serine protease